MAVFRKAAGFQSHSIGTAVGALENMDDKSLFKYIIPDRRHQVLNTENGIYF